MSGYTPLYPWANGRASGLSLNATRFLGELDHMGDYVEGFVGGGLSIQNQTGSGTLTLDMSNRQECLWVVTLNGTSTQFNLLGMAAGDSVTLVVYQDSVGGRNYSLPTAKWDDGAIPTQTLTAGGIDIRGFFSDGTTVFGFDSGTGFA